MQKRSAPRTGARTISGSLLARKRELDLAQKRSAPAPQARELTAKLYFFVSDFIRPPSAMIFWMNGGKGSA